MTGEASDAAASHTVSLIVPVGGDAHGVRRCFDSISRLDPPPGEIVVVLDGDNPVLSRAAGEIGATVLTRPLSGGPAIARNRGAASARGDILFFVDADVGLPFDAVRRIAAFFDSNPDQSAIFGSYDAEPAERGFFSQFRNLLHHFVHQHGRAEASTFWAGCGAVRRSAFREVGGFDENYPVPCIEDIELGSRLRGSGFSICLAKDLQVKHLKRWRLGNMLATDLLRRAVPWTRLMLHEGRLVNDLNVKTNDRWSVALACVLPVLGAAGTFWPTALGAGVAAAALLLILNRELYGFFLRHRGAAFALHSILWHWVYLVVCGLGFALGAACHMIDRLRRPSGADI